MTAPSSNSTNKTNFNATTAQQITKFYELEETIGQGHFAVVKLGKHIFTGEKVAIKVIDKTKLDPISHAHLFQEVKCMKLVQHPNVVRLYEVIDTTTKLYLILELGDGGDMYDYIMRHNNGLSETKARNYFKQILRAIKYCHDLHVVHRDLKPENVVFFERTGEVKLTDFGFSNIFTPGKKLNTSCGSLAYSAPEILLGDSYDAPAVDVWSLGVILYMLVTGHAPFQEANDSETLTMILDCKYYLPPELSIECKNLISRMLVREPENRIELNDIAKHDWLLINDENSSNQIIIKEDNYDEPLVKRKVLAESLQNEIVNSMIKGNIATQEDIKSALIEDKYNYITATYYLLAERILRRNSPSNQNYDQNYTNYKNKNQPSKGSLNKNQQPQQQQQQKLIKTNSNKRKFNNNVIISEVDSHEEELNEINENSNKKNLENGEKPSFHESQEFSLNKNSDTNIIDSINKESNDDCDDVVDDSTTTNNSNLQNTKRLGGGGGGGNTREFLAFAIPEEAEEMNSSTAEMNKENDSNSSKSTTKHNNNHVVHNPHYLLREIHEEAESDQNSDPICEIGGNNDLTAILQQQQKKITKYPSISASSTDDDADMDNNNLTNEEALKLHKTIKSQKTKTKKTHQSRIRPVSISDMMGNNQQNSSNDQNNNEEQPNNYKVTIRAKSVESSEFSPLKLPQQQISSNGNDLAPPSNYNLKSLSIEHRLANISQMSISSQLSKTNSIRHNSRSGACDTPIQHIHSSTPTPRESIVFNRGDEKPIAKILLQQQQIYKLNQIQTQHQQQQQQQTSQNQSVLLSNGGLSLQSQQSSLNSNNNNNNNKLSNDQLKINSDSELSEYENTTLKSNKNLLSNTENSNSNLNNNTLKKTQNLSLINKNNNISKITTQHSIITGDSSNKVKKNLKQNSSTNRCCYIV